MMEEKHTPLPWKIKMREHSIAAVVYTGKCEMQILHTSWHSSIRASYPLHDEAVANMELAVSSVNSLPALVKALEECQKALAAIVEPRAIKSTTVICAFNQATEAECNARSALATYRSAKT